jgi:hypothetical protein
LKQIGSLVLYPWRHTSNVVVGLVETNWWSGVIPVETHFPSGDSPG